jgi:hypothetical protein
MATAREPMIQREDGRREFHFDCENGHAFHTDTDITQVYPCDCKPRPRKHTERKGKGSAGLARL